MTGVPPPARPISYADRDWFRRLQETRRFTVSDFVIGKVIPQPFMPLAYPVLDSRGEISSVLVAGFSVDWLNNFLKTCQLPPGTHALLIDRQGVILANYPHGEETVGQSLPQSPLIRAMLDRQEGYVEAGCPGEGNPVIYAFTGVGEGDAPLKLAVGFDKALLLQQVNRVFLFHLSLLGLAAGLALTGALAFGNLLVRRPVLRILEATRQVAAGDLEARTGLPGRKGELNRLGQAFDEMAAALQQREAEAEEYLLQVGPLQKAIFNSANFSSIATDAKGVIQIFNVGAERMLGYTAAEVVDKITPAEISDPREVIERAAALSLELETTITPGFEALVFKASRGIEDIYGLTYIRKDGSRFPAIVSVTALRDAQDTIIGYLLIGTDNTARKQAEAIIEQKAAELARSNAELEQFAYVASHDLQEPLRIITNYLQLLERRAQGKLDDDVKKYIDRAVGAGGRMRTLITDLLTYSRVGSRANPLESVNSDALLEDTLAVLKLALEMSGATVTHDPLPTVMADWSQLGQLFQNLLSNGLKFRREEAPRLHVAATREDRAWVFAVSDNGIGIEPEYLDRIFGVFQRLHTRSEFPGTGIGLAICKKIVERHGGRIWVESAFGQGSTFYFTIPENGGPAS
ncbi:MAG: ATP-binding protein [Desulfobacterales bacterium]|nr:ATP-binding protein [Desulfobacterales bacterium]